MTWSGQWTAEAIAAAVRDGRTTPDAVVTEALDRIRERDPGLNAFVALLPDPVAEARAMRSTGVLAGVPVAIKDTVPVAGMPMRVGSLATSHAPQPTDHPIVARLRAAGAIPLGITAVPELCTFGTTDTATAITRNPWNRELSPGGSSGGSAAAVAAGMVPVAHAADGMGSIRIPAAATGIVGLKPGLGVIPAELGVNDWFGMSENGPMGTTVEDVALLLSVMAERPELAEVTEPHRSLSVAVSLTPPATGVELDVDMGRAATRAASLLASQGHRVTRTEPGASDIGVTAAALAAMSRWFAGTALDAASVQRDRLEPRTRMHAAIGRALLGTKALSDGPRRLWLATAESLLAGHDLLITPALAAPPPRALAWHERSWAANLVSNIRFAPYAAPWNLAGFPAMVVPVGVHPRAGIPIAAQLVGRPGDEALLLSVAAVLQSLNPWERTAPIG